MEPTESAAPVSSTTQPAPAGGDAASSSSPAGVSPDAARRTSESVAADAQAFLDAAYAGLSGEAETPPATPATPAEATAAEEIAAEGPAAEARRLSRKERAEQARASQKPAEATPAAAPDPAPAPAPAAPPPEQVIAEYERQRADRERAEQEARQRSEYFARWTGDTRTAPNGPTEYEQAQAVAMTPVPAISEYATNEEIAAHNEAVNRQAQAIARVRELNERRAMLAAQEQPVAQRARQEAITFVASGFEAAIAETGADLEAVLRAGAAVPDLGGRVPAMVRALAEQVTQRVRAQEVTPKDAEIERLRADLSERDEQIAAHTSELDALRRRLGGQVPQPERGGVAAPAGRTSLDALDAIHPSKLRGDDLAPFLDLLPAGPSRRR